MNSREFKDVRFRSVKYLRLNELNDVEIPVDDMPFIKRWPYRCEDEYLAMMRYEIDLTHGN